MINQSNKQLKASDHPTSFCPIYLACEVEFEFIDRSDSDLRSNECKPNQACFEGIINSRCVNLEGTEACIEYADAEVQQSSSPGNTYHWNNTRQNFYYAWQSNNILRASVISNHKKLKVEGKQQVIKFVKNSLSQDND